MIFCNIIHYEKTAYFPIILIFSLIFSFLLTFKFFIFIFKILNFWHLKFNYICIKAVIKKIIGTIITVQPFISYIHKPASELSVAALQLMFTHFRNERLFYHKKVLNNTMNKLIVLPSIFLWLNCYEQ